MISKENLFEAFSREGINLNDYQAEQLALLSNKTLEVNEYMNLTGIKDEPTFISKMLVDSAIPLKFINFSNAKVLDIGTGGGFPGLVLAILYPEGSFTLIDSTKKKIAHCQDMVELLKLNNVTCIADRVENYFHGKNRETFDYVLARAVTDIKTLVKYSAPLLNKDGRLIAYKGLSYEDEIKVANRAFKQNHLDVIYVSRYSLYDFPDEKRYIIQIAKKSA